MADDQMCDPDRGISSARASMYNVLRSLIQNNIEHFQEDNSSLGKRFHAAFVRLEEHLDLIEPQVDSIRRIASRFDFHEKIPGNGYRSFISVVDACALQCIRLCRHICINRSSFIFRSGHYCREVEAYTATMGSLKAGLTHLQTLFSWSKDGDLYPDEEHSPEELLMEAESIDQQCFYGRCLAFQFSESMRKPLLVILLAMASFSEAYFNTGGVLARTASSLYNCGRYALSPEERGRRVVQVSQRASVEFCKAFWLLQETELMQQLPAFVCPPVAVNKVFTITPESPLRLPKADGSGMVDIPIPLSHIGAAPVCCRLLSSVQREGQVEEEDEKQRVVHNPVMPPSPYLIIQCHGGGFVAQSSKSHEVYLREWARQLDVPILCIDYSLAPVAPFPRALEECLYIYCWALQNASQLGTTCERICLLGDSAGGNLMMGLALKTIELGIRKPEALFALYTPLLIQFIPSPSRLLCLMDPLLPFGFMMKCLKAYAGEPLDEETTKENDKENSVKDNAETEKPNDELDSQKVKSETQTTNIQQQPAKEFASEGQISRTPEDTTIKDIKALRINAKPLESETKILENEGKSLANEGKSLTNEIEALQNDIKIFQNNGKTLQLETGLQIESLASSSGRRNSDTESYEELSFNEMLEVARRTLEEGGGSSGGVTRSDTMTTVSLTSESNSRRPSESNNDEEVPEKSKEDEYVSDFLKKYVLEKDREDGIPVLSVDAMESEENVLFEMPVDFSLGITSKLSRVTSKVMSGISSWIPTGKLSEQTTSTFEKVRNVMPSSCSESSLSQAEERQMFTSTIPCQHEFKKFKVSKDPYLSPYLASDEVLKQLPQISMMALQLDPCLDDSVMFCKRLKTLGLNPRLLILDKLPHGFLNFSLISRDAWEGSKICIEEMAHLLHLEDDRLSSTSKKSDSRSN